MTDLSGVGVRVLLIATATHHGPTLSSVPSIVRTFEDVRMVLMQRCGVRVEGLRPLLDPPDARTMALAVAEEAQRAETVLLVYFIGHGLLGPDNELYLAASGTDRLVPGLAEHQAMSFSSLRQAVGSSRASSVVVLLDCCFSGRVSLADRGAVPALAMAPEHGLYLIGSAEQLALAPPDAVHTAFSGAFINVLMRGDPRGPHLLTLDAVYDAVFRALRDQGRPLPRRQAGDRSGGLVIAANPALPVPAPEQPEPAPGRCPYPGLDAFAADDADVYFGRERTTRQLLDAIATAAGQVGEPGPLILVGPSGSGKTSLLNAGFLAGLRNGGLPGLPGSAGWPCLRFTPGPSPLRSLATQLDAGLAAERLRQDPDGAVELADGLVAGRAGQRLIVLVDQIEEVFTSCPDPSERAAFLQAVSALASPAGDHAPGALVVLALRADFYGQAAAHPELLAALRDRQLLVEPMALDELRAAIERPAAATGLTLDDGLADVILHELGATTDGQPAIGVLPLLSHALWSTWRYRAGSRLTVAGYRAAGGITQAIATTAEQVYTTLDAAGQDAVRRMLPRLVRVHDELADAALPVDLAALVHGLPDVPAAQRAIDRLTNARLLTLDRDTARISHEALLRAWPRLREWLDADRDWLRAHQQLADDARAWERSGRDPSLLYRGTRLAAMRQRAAEAPGSAADIEPVSAAFMDASRQDELRNTRRRKRRVVVLATLLVIAIGLGGVAVWQGLNAAHRGQVAAQQRDDLASKAAGHTADLLRDADPGLAMQLALAAHRVADTPEARTSLYNSALVPYDTLLTGHTDVVKSLDYNPDRHLLVSASPDHTVRLWDHTDPRRPRAAAVIHSDVATDAAFAPTGQLLAAGNTGTGQQLWDIGDPDKPTQVATLPGAHGSLAFSPDGHRLAVANKIEVTLWNLTDPRRPARTSTIPLRTTDVMSVSISADGRTLAAAVGPEPGNERGNYLVELWDVTDPSHPVEAATMPDTHAFGVAFSPRAPLLAVGGSKTPADLWDVTNPTRPVLITTPDVFTDLPRSGVAAALAFSRDGHSLAVGISSGGASGDRIGIFDVSDPRKTRVIAEYPMPTLINAVAFGDSPATVFGSGKAPVIHSWHAPLAATLPKPTSLVGVVDWSFTPDSRILVLENDDAEFQLWRTAAANDASRIGTLTTTSAAAKVIALNNHTLLESSAKENARLWDITDPTKPVPRAELPPIQRLLAGNDVDTDGRTVAINGTDGLIHLLNIDNPAAPVPLSTVPRPEHSGGLAISTDGHTLYVIDQASGIRIWDITEPRRPVEIARLSAVSDGGAIAILAGQIDGGPGKHRRFAITESSINPREIQLWDVDDTHNPPRSKIPPTPANEFMVSYDGKILAVTTPKTVDLWDIRDIYHPAKIASLPAVAQTQLRFSPDDHLLVTASTKSSSLLIGSTETTELHVWDVSDPHNGFEIGTPKLSGVINSFDFGPDGTMLMVSANSGESIHGEARLLDLDIGRLTQQLCNAMGTTLTPDQWKEYFPGTPYTPPCD